MVFSESTKKNKTGLADLLMLTAQRPAFTMLLSPDCGVWRLTLRLTKVNEGPGHAEAGGNLGHAQ